MYITDPEDAKQYFNSLVGHLMVWTDESVERAEQIVKTNLGYFAGYYGDEVRERVERLFDCAHPYFGRIAEQGPITPEQAFNMGMKLGEELKKSQDHADRTRVPGEDAAG